ncbi:MAG: thioredoxin family protein [Pseudomonadota bacterium]
MPEAEGNLPMLRTGAKQNTFIGELNTMLTQTRRFQKILPTHAGALLLGLICLSCSTPAVREVITPPEPFVSDNVKHIATQPALDAIVLNAPAGTLTIVCYTSKFCKACGPYSDTFRETALRYSDNGKLLFTAIDIYYDDTVLEKAEITIIPTTLIFRNGKKIKELTGPGTREDLIAIIDQLK